MVSRRVFLKQASLSTAGLVIGCGTDPLARDDQATQRALAEGDALGVGYETRQPFEIEPPEDTIESALFPLGVSSGDVDGDRVTLWTRYDGDRPLEICVWLFANDQYFGHARLPVEKGDGNFVHVDVTQLQAGKRYRYAFFEKNDDGTRLARTIVGRFRAPIGADEEVPLVFGAIACCDDANEFTTLQRAAESETELDTFLFLGDTAYCDGAYNVDEYREKWVDHIGKSEHVALRASTSVYATWDDHEFKNDLNPERTDVEQLDAARQAFFENLPMRRLADAPNQLWRSRRWGRTVEIFLVDSRTERLPSTISSDAEQYISRAQMDWLKQGLSDSPCRFKLIMNSVPITRFPNVWNVWQIDRWDAYDAQRTEILSHIDDNEIPGVLWVSGDFHLAKMGMIAREGELGANQLEVLVGPGAQNGNILRGTLIDPYFHWSSDENNYTQIHMDPATGEVRFVYVAADGSVLAERTYSL